METKNILICTKIILFILRKESLIQLLQQAVCSDTLHSVHGQSVRNINS